MIGGTWFYLHAVEKAATHSHARDHHHHVPHSTRGLRIAFFLNLFFTLFEVAGGLWTDSIAVLTDALHDLGDCAVLGAAWYLQGIAGRGRDDRYSYGYGRYSMLGGWLAAGILIIGSIAMFAFSVPRVLEPELPHTQGMILMAVFGLAMHAIAAWVLHGGQTLNERGVYLHLLEDVLGWAAVLIGAVIMHYTGFARIDPLLSMAISLFILFNAIGTLRSGTKILMQAQPGKITSKEIHDRLIALPDVIDVHDQHTWSLDGNYLVHTVHLVINESSLRDALSTKTKAREILTSLGIDHATIELELPDEQCEAEDHVH